MKNIKVFILVIVLFVIGFLVWIAFKLVPEPPLIPKSSNQFVLDFEKQIFDISSYDSTNFCTDLFLSTSNELNIWRDKNYLGEDEIENINQYNRLHALLNSAYISKFLQQANYSMNYRSCDNSEMLLIKEELRNLNELHDFTYSAQLLLDFWQIQRKIDSYFDVIGFIKRCQSYSFKENSSTGVAIRNPTFFIDDYHRIFNKISEGQFVNCSSLNSDFESLKMNLFLKHSECLMDKINELASPSNYGCCNNHSSWVLNVYDSLQDEIIYLGNNDYSVDIEVKQNEINRLQGLLDNYNTDSYNHNWGN